MPPGDWRQMIAVIGDSANAASIGLHAALGFRHVGTLHAVGFKFGRWIDSVLMQRALTSIDAVSARIPARSLARRRGARHHADSRLGRDLLHAGPDAAADRRGAGIFLHLRDGRLLGRPAGGRPAVADGRRPDRSSWRPLGDAVRLARRRGRPRRPHAGEPSARLSRRCGCCSALPSRPRSTIRPSRRWAGSSAPTRAPRSPC